MSAAKKELAASITQRYKKIHANLESDSASNAGYQSIASKEDLETLRLLRKTVTEMQVWPFNYRSLALFFSSLSTPLFLIYFAAQMFGSG
jgi:hypothetical protein